MRFCFLLFLFISQLAYGADPSCYEQFLPRKNRSVRPSMIATEIIPEGDVYGTLRKSQLAYSRLEPLEGRNISRLEKILKEKEVEHISPLGGGVNSTSIVELSDGTRAVWKPHYETWSSNYRAEVLAYEIDAKFSFDMVPVTVEREINGQKGSLQLFMDSTDNGMLHQSQLDKQSFFDFIIDNRDRHAGNYLASPSGDEVIAIDNGLSFTGLGFNQRSFFRRRKQIDRYLKSEEGKEMIERLRGADFEKLQTEFRSYLGEEDAERLVRRMKFSIKYFEDNLLLRAN